MKLLVGVALALGFLLWQVRTESSRQTQYYDHYWSCPLEELKREIDALYRRSLRYMEEDKLERYVLMLRRKKLWDILNARTQPQN